MKKTVITGLAIVNKGCVVYPAISRDVVTHLKEEGRTLKEIGRLMGVSESFISRVLKRQRSLTLDHLGKLEKVLSKPLPIILLEAADPDSVSDELRPAYRAFQNVMAVLGSRSLGASLGAKAV